MSMVLVCQACGANTFQMLKWFEHVYSYEHGEVKLTEVIYRVAQKLLTVKQCVSLQLSCFIYVK